MKNAGENILRTSGIMKQERGAWVQLQIIKYRNQEIANKFRNRKGGNKEVFYKMKRSEARNKNLIEPTIRPFGYVEVEKSQQKKVLRFRKRENCLNTNFWLFSPKTLLPVPCFVSNTL